MNPDPCLSLPYKVEYVCRSAPGMKPNLTLEHIAASIFNNIILDRLHDHCTNRTWCLGSLYDGILMDQSEEYLNYCPLLECLENMTIACVDSVSIFIEQIVL